MLRLRNIHPETPHAGPAAARLIGQAECRARARAEEACERLQLITRDFAAIGRTDPRSNHQYFAQLYLCTTRHWLARLPKDPDRLFAYLVIPPFLALYERHVCDVLDAPLERVARHWRGYHRLARNPALSPGQRLRLVVRAAYAHTHHDLGQVIRDIERGMAEPFARRGSASRRVMFGETASRAFADAAAEFFSTASRCDGSSVYGRAGGAPVRMVTRPLWVPTLHLSRLSGYYHARLGGRR